MSSNRFTFAGIDFSKDLFGPTFKRHKWGEVVFPAKGPFYISAFFYGGYWRHIEIQTYAEYERVRDVLIEGLKRAKDSTLAPDTICFRFYGSNMEIRK